MKTGRRSAGRVSLLFLIGLLCWQAELSAQGCSDAGFCSIGANSLEKSAMEKSLTNELKFTTSFGSGDEHVLVLAPALEYKLNLSSHWQLQSKVTVNYASGELAGVAGLGDFFASAKYARQVSKKWTLAFSAGGKFPLNQGNLKENGLSLPMQYQSSLGTIDLIGGLALSSEKWQFAFGWQQSLSGRNRNNFLPVYWMSKDAMRYPPSNDFNRRGDLLGRAFYSFKAGKKLSVDAGLLAVYHLAEDTYIDANTSLQPIPLKGSKGFTINVTGGLEYKPKERLSYSILFGAPVIARDLRPDGLTRKFVVTPGISFHF